MKTVKQLKENLDPMTIWNVIKDRNEEHRKQRRIDEYNRRVEKARKYSDKVDLFEDFKIVRKSDGLTVNVVEFEEYLSKREAENH